MNELIIKLIHLAVREHLTRAPFYIINECRYTDDEEDEGYYRYDHYGCTDHFTPEVEEKYNIQVLSNYQYHPSDTDHILSFEVVGLLGDIFDRLDLDTVFTGAYSTHDGDWEQTVLKFNDFEENFVLHPGLPVDIKYIEEIRDYIVSRHCMELLSH